MKALCRPMLRRVIRALYKRQRTWKRAWDIYTLPNFANQPARLRFSTPRDITNPEAISFGDDCFIGPDSSLTACRAVRAPFAVQQFSGRIVIGARVWATRALQIFASEEIVIEDDVMLAANVFVCDCHHGYATAEVPYKNQPFAPRAPIRIGRGCWIGQNVVILPGVTIGEQTIVGANSVVSRSLPARVIAVGSPARIIKRFDGAARSWVRVQSDHEN